MSPSNCEDRVRGLGFQPYPGARLIQIHNHMVPFVTWALGGENVSIYYHWPGREYAGSVVTEINRLNEQSVTDAEGLAAVHGVIQFCS